MKIVLVQMASLVYERENSVAVVDVEVPSVWFFNVQQYYSRIRVVRKASSGISSVIEKTTREFNYFQLSEQRQQLTN